MAAISASPAEPSPYNTCTLNGTGFALTTSYTVNVTTPDGQHTFAVTSDGAGAWSLPVQLDEPGTVTVTATPVDVVAASLTFTTADS